MIRYALRCAQGHRFDSWFASGAEFDRLQGARLLSCAVCGDARLEKDLMAPSLAAGTSAPAGEDRAASGRGPLAGPVVAAAVILDPDNIPEGLHDSKQLSAARREALFTLILQSAFVSVASSGAQRIDETDIRKASLDAMRRAVAGLEIAPKLVLTDGRDVPPGLACEGRAVVKGDALSVSISAASIVAKVTRDRMMARAEATYPGYGFSIHAGYATEIHRKAIETLGPCALHRMSFRPLRKD